MARTTAKGRRPAAASDGRAVATPTEDGCTAASHRRASAAAPDGSTPAAAGRAGSSGGSQEVPAERSEMLIVWADRTGVWPDRP